MDNLNSLKPKDPYQAFNSYEPGFMHVDVNYLRQMPDETNRRYLFAAIDKATRWVFVQVKSHEIAEAVRLFLNALHKACSIRI
ncbi:hypothetical protein KIK84_14915 [Curvibacter sp. CHRR-16]|nr:hypothetical protein [Curvibacter sp. CHRR-16]